MSQNPILYKEGIALDPALGLGLRIPSSPISPLRELPTTFRVASPGSARFISDVTSAGVVASTISTLFFSHCSQKEGQIQLLVEEKPPALEAEPRLLESHGGRKSGR